MAKADFKCADCGASVRVSGHNRSDADRKAAWHEAEGHVCDDCAAKRRAAENAVAAAANLAEGLPALTGSEKQIACAAKTRSMIASSRRSSARATRLRCFRQW